MRVISNLRSKRASYRQLQSKSSSDSKSPSLDDAPELEDLEIIETIDNIVRVTLQNLSQDKDLLLQRLDKVWRQFEKMANFGALAAAGAQREALFQSVVEAQLSYVTLKEKILNPPPSGEMSELSENSKRAKVCLLVHIFC